MSTTTSLPATNSIGDFLTTLYGLQIDVTEASTLESEAIYATAHYTDDADVLQASIFCDLEGAAKLGAALTQIPIGGVEDAIESGSLPDNLQENLAEIFNILVNLFPNHQTQRLALKEVVWNADAASEQPQLNGELVGFDLNVQRYGSGKFSIAMAK